LTQHPTWHRVKKARGRNKRRVSYGEKTFTEGSNKFLVQKKEFYESLSGVQFPSNLELPNLSDCKTN